MEKFNTDERTGLRYELVGDYYLIAGDDEPEEQHTSAFGASGTSGISKSIVGCYMPTC